MGDEEGEENGADKSSATPDSSNLKLRAEIEKARARQAIAHTAERGLESLDKLGGFFADILGPPAKELSGLVTQWVAYKRENLERARRKFEDILRDREITGETRQVPLRVGVPLLEKMALEDEDVVLDMWAALLANSVDPKLQFQPRRIFVSLLSELEPLDARVIQRLGTIGWHAFPNVPGGGYDLERLQNELDVGDLDLKTSLLNLFRLGLLIDEKPETLEGLDSTTSGLRVHDKGAFFRLTSLGYDLHEACRPDRDEDEPESDN